MISDLGNEEFLEDVELSDENDLTEISYSSEENWTHLQSASRIMLRPEHCQASKTSFNILLKND